MHALGAAVALTRSTTTTPAAPAPPGRASGCADATRGRLGPPVVEPVTTLPPVTSTPGSAAWVTEMLAQLGARRAVFRSR